MSRQLERQFPVVIRDEAMWNAGKTNQLRYQKRPR